MTTAARTPYHSWTDADFESMIRYRRSGMDMNQIAAKIGVATRSLEDAVKRRKARDPEWAARFAIKPKRGGRPKRPWADAERAKVRELASQGHSMSAVAALVGYCPSWLRWKMGHDEPTRAAWEEGAAIAQESAGGPISDELKALAAAALEAGMERRQFAAWSSAFLAACKSNADIYGGVCIAEVAGALRCSVPEGYRMARTLRGRGMFPYRFSARDVAPVASLESEAEDIRELYATAKAAREVQLPTDDRDESWRCVLTPDYHGPTLTPEAIEAAERQSDREDVRRYARESRQRRKTGTPMHGPEHYREMQQIGLEAMRERNKWNRKQAVA